MGLDSVFSKCSVMWWFSQNAEIAVENCSDTERFCTDDKGNGPGVFKLKTGGKCVFCPSGYGQVPDLKYNVNR